MLKAIHAQEDRKVALENAQSVVDKLKEMKLYKAMKKASIITILDVTNIGTYLQAYALGRVIEEQGMQVEYVDYIRPVSSWNQVAKSRWNKNGGGVRGAGAVLYGLCLDTFSLKNCKSFLTSRMQVSKKYRSFTALKKDPPLADIYITGSDQVWNPVHNQGLEKAYFLEYAASDAPRVAYAASIGSDHIPESCKGEMIRLLCKYDRIATREASAQKLLKQEGIANVATVLDPTLLLDKEEWSEVAESTRFVKTEPYLLVYSVEHGRKSLVSEIASHIAAQRGLKVYFVTPRWFSSSVQYDRAFYFSNPVEFLSLFLNADFAVVSSFHGTAFAINFNIPFLSVVPDRFNSRIAGVLERTGLLHRMVSAAAPAIEEFPNPVNWQFVNDQISNDRTESLEYLRGTLSLSAGS